MYSSYVALVFKYTLMYYYFITYKMSRLQRQSITTNSPETIIRLILPLLSFPNVYSCLLPTRDRTTHTKLTRSNITPVLEL